MTAKPQDLQADLDLRLIVNAWNIMGGTIKWEALELLADVLGVIDHNVWVDGLIELQRQMRERDK